MYYYPEFCSPTQALCSSVPATIVGHDWMTLCALSDGRHSAGCLEIKTVSRYASLCSAMVPVLMPTQPPTQPLVRGCCCCGKTIKLSCMPHQVISLYSGALQLAAAAANLVQNIRMKDTPRARPAAVVVAVVVYCRDLLFEIEKVLRP